MISLRRFTRLQADAKYQRQVALTAKRVGRAGQISRSSVETGDGTASVGDLLADAPTVAETVEDHVADLETLDPGLDVFDDTQESEDAAHLADMNAIASDIKATAAQVSADGKAMIFRSTDLPDPDQGTPGDRWEQYDKSGTPWKLLGSWSRETSGWEPVELDSTYLPLVDIGNGTFGQLGGARLEADALYGKLLSGNEIIGGIMRGGFFELLGFGAPLFTLNDNMNALTNWSGLLSGVISRDTSIFRSSTAAIRMVPATTQSALGRTLTLGANSGLAGSIWVWSPVATRITPFVRTVADRASSVSVDVPASVWTEVAFSIANPPPRGTVGWTGIEFAATSDVLPAYVVFDDLSVKTVATDNRRLTIEREASGSPAVLGFEGGLPRFRLTTTGTDASAKGGLLELWAQFNNGQKSVLDGNSLQVFGSDGQWGSRVNSQSFVFANRPSVTAPWIESQAPRGLRIRASGAVGSGTSPDVEIVSNNGDVRLTAGAGRVVEVVGALVNPGNTFALKSQLDAWAPIDGTHAWVTATGFEYIRARGKWIVNSTNGEVDITSSLLAAYRGTMKYSVAGGTLFLNINASGAIGVGQTVVGNLASDLSPSGLMAGAARLSSDYAGSFLVNAAGAVVVATRTGVTHTAATGAVMYAMV